ncbi:MAG: hypothetical protein JW922_10635 [Paludibacteraceae bacterium]|nr:hypothetical protein [Paludibacteraceae bacterium]
MRTTRLGIDMGTNSIGWAILEKVDGKYVFYECKDEKGNLIPSKGSYIFSKGTGPNEQSKAAIRRGFRGARRRIDRVRLRKIATLKVLEDFDLCPKFQEGELNRWKDKKQYPCDNEEFIKWQRTGTKGGDVESEKLKQPYYLRYLASTKKGLMNTQQGKYELGRAFYHIAQRRGYLSNGEEEQTEDTLDQFKQWINKLCIENSTCLEFREPFEVIADHYKNDKKVKPLCKKISKQLEIDSSFDKLKMVIETEFSRNENLGKVEGGILELSKRIKASGMPTLGAYFHSIYGESKEDGTIKKIRGVFVHREKHYLNEFDYICNLQGINGVLRNKLQNAIFYQRPLKSQKNFVGKCPLETKRKRIAVSHPLFEQFRMWESINRIKIKTENDSRLRFLNKEEKDQIAKMFIRKTDFDFEKIANELCQGKSKRYIKDRKVTEAQIEFNFPMDKTFSACPTIYQIQKTIGKEKYNTLVFLNESTKEEKNKQEVSIEDVWHCLFVDSFGEKSKQEARINFAQKHLGLNEENATAFSKIQLKKGYGSLSRAAIKKIIPFLELGEHYSNAVFLANTNNVLGRKLLKNEFDVVKKLISEALKKHQKQKTINGIVNNYIEKFKFNKDGLSSNENSIWIHKQAIKDEIRLWFTEAEFDEFSKAEIDEIEQICWNNFSEQVKDILPKSIEFVKSDQIPTFIKSELELAFPNDVIQIDKLYHPSAMEAYPKAENKLGNPEITSIKNPVFYKAMYQIRRLVNTLINEGMIDKDTEVNVEMAREINSASYRKALSQYQSEQQTIRNWAKNKIIECYKSGNKVPTEEEITKYILFEEQNKVCLYTNQTITPRMIYEDQQFDIEHTIPRSKSNDNSINNKTLANARFNRDYKKDDLPANINLMFNGVLIDKDSILNNRDSKLKSYSISNNGNVVEYNVSLETLKSNCKKLKNAAKAASDPVVHEDIMTRFHLAKLKYEYLKDKYRRFEIEEITSKFSNANLVDTRIISKYTRAYLKSYFNKVNVVNGQITDTLRKIWGLQDEFSAKDRSNHIHHCIDAVTVACVEKGTVNRISQAYHNYERDYFDGNLGATAHLKEPMKDFVSQMKHLHEEIFIYHHKTDRIKPLLEEKTKNNPQKLNLRGPLNNKMPYGVIKKDDEKIFVQREPISKLTGKDVENIVDKSIKGRLLELASLMGWKQAVGINIKDGDNLEELILRQKKELALKIYLIVIKLKKNKELLKGNITVDDFDGSFDCPETLKNEVFLTCVVDSLNEEKKNRLKEKISVAVNNEIRTKGLTSLLNESNGVIILPANDKVGKMIIKKVRLKKKVNANPLKERRKMDFPKGENQDHKRDYYFDKEAGSNYEAILYGDLIPNDKGKMQRDYRLINNYNIVKGISKKEPELPLLFKIHRDDMFIVFDKHVDEIEWGNRKEIQFRTFKNVKFDENGILVFQRHNYALGDIDHATPVNESDLNSSSGIVLRRRPSTLRAIPTKVDELGRIDIEYSKQFIEKNIK